LKNGIGTLKVGNTGVIVTHFQRASVKLNQS
jgi:hypothetical protein